MTDIIVTVTRAVTPDMICDLMCTAFEGGINYWCDRIEAVKGRTDWSPDKLVWWGHTKFWKDEFEVEFYVSDECGDDRHQVFTLDNAKLREGLQKITREDPTLAHGEMTDRCARINQVIDGEYDADDADNILQLILFGEVVYG